MCHTDIKSNQLKHLQIPQYDTLTVQKLYWYISSYPDTFRFYPDEQTEIKKLPKQWIANVAYSVLGEQFCEWVSKQIEERNAKIAEKGNLMVELDPEVAEAFEASTSIASKY